MRDNALSQKEIKELKKDGSPAAVKRLLNFLKQFDFTEIGGRDMRDTLDALTKLDEKKARGACIRLLEKASSTRNLNGNELLLAKLCRDLAGDETALPVLKKFADSCWRLKLVFKGKYHPHIRIPVYWRGMPAVVACRTILDTEGVGLEDESHPYLRKARGMIVNAVEAVDELDKFKAEYYPNGYEERRDFLEKYWDAVDEIESDIDCMLSELDEDMYSAEESSWPHVFRAIERFDFENASGSFQEAFPFLDEIDNSRVKRDVRMLTEMAAGSETLSDYEDAFLGLCRLIVEKGYKECLPHLKQIARRKDRKYDNSYLKKIGRKGEEAVIIIACKAILDLDGQDVESNSLYARKARNACARREAALAWQFDICMHTDIGDGLDYENRLYGEMKDRLDYLKGILYRGT